MEISYLGANCVLLNTKAAKILVDPIVPGLEVNTLGADIILLTNEQKIIIKDDQLLINSPGEYEARGVSIIGISARAHMGEEQDRSAVIYRIDINGYRFGIMGHIYPELSDEQLEKLGMVDILIIPVGGHGYTLDAEGASKVIRDIEPKVVIPTHFNDKDVKYEVPQSELQSFLDEIGTSAIEETKYKVKDDELPEQLTVISLSRTS